MFIGDLHNDPSTFAWQVRQTEPEYEATETEAAEEPAAGNELDGV